MSNLSTDTLAGRCARYLLDNSLTTVTEHGVQVMLPVTPATLSELVDLVERERHECQRLHD